MHRAAIISKKRFERVARNSIRMNSIGNSNCLSVCGRKHTFLPSTRSMNCLCVGGRSNAFGRMTVSKFIPGPFSSTTLMSIGNSNCSSVIRIGRADTALCLGSGDNGFVGIGNTNLVGNGYIRSATKSVGGSNFVSLVIAKRNVMAHIFCGCKSGAFTLNNIPSRVAREYKTVGLISVGKSNALSMTSFN